jgi:cell division septation protein DedD
MDFKFSKDSDGTEPREVPGDKKNQSALVVLLLLLVGGFAYLYFFTGLIRPQEAQKPAPPPSAAAPQAVKMPLPPRTEEPAKPAEKGGEKAAAKTAANVVSAPGPAPVPAPAPVKTPAVKPAAVPAVPAKPAVTPAAPAPVPAKAQAEAKKSEPAKPADRKPAPAVVANSKPAVPPAKAETKKTAITDKKSAAPPKETAKSPKTAVQTKPLPATAGKKVLAGSWSLYVGNYVLGEALSADMGQVRKAGFEPVVKSSTGKKTAMNRLFVADFTERAAAQATMEKLRRQTSDAFVIEQGGRFSLYAGSYLQSESARSEKERLSAAGFSTTVKQVDIAIPSQSLTVGPFSNRKTADAALVKLKNAGIKASLTQK